MFTVSPTLDRAEREQGLVASGLSGCDNSMTPLGIDWGPRSGSVERVIGCCRVPALASLDAEWSHHRSRNDAGHALLPQLPHALALRRTPRTLSELPAEARGAERFRGP